jgi:hypothetical protein
VTSGKSINRIAVQTVLQVKQYYRSNSITVQTVLQSKQYYSKVVVNVTAGLISVIEDSNFICNLLPAANVTAESSAIAREC